MSDPAHPGAAVGAGLSLRDRRLLTPQQRAEALEEQRHKAAQLQGWSRAAA